MSHQKIEWLSTKLSLTLGMVTGGLTLTEIDVYLGLLLKIVSILSFIVVLVLNSGKLIIKIKEWFKK